MPTPVLVTIPTATEPIPITPPKRLEPTLATIDQTNLNIAIATFLAVSYHVKAVLTIFFFQVTILPPTLPLI